MNRGELVGALLQLFFVLSLDFFAGRVFDTLGRAQEPRYDLPCKYLIWLT
jgi:hypothetical protein